MAHSLLTPPMLDAEGFAATRLVTNLLDSLEVPYVIGGSVASMAHGVIRSTMDVDIVADLQPEHVAPLLRALSSAFYVDEPSLRQAIERRGSFNLIHLETMVKVDVFLPQDRPFDKQQLARRIPERISPDDPKALWILTAEDTVLAKLDWFRLGGEVSERQWRDILGLLKTQGEALDIAYLRRWAAELDVVGLLARALDEAAQ